MRAITLTLAGLPADLPATTKGLIRLTQARAALSELSARKGEFSWPLTLPATRDNARIFGVNVLHTAGLDKFSTTDYPFELRCGGEFFAGTFRLSSVRGGYTGQLLGEGFSWAAELGEKKLTDLRLPPIAYNGSQIERIMGLSCDFTDVQFPLLSFGNFFHPPYPRLQRDGSAELVSLPPSPLLRYPLSVDDYLPSVYLRSVLRQMFTDIGWHLTGKVLDEARWRETLITPAGSSPADAWPWGALLPTLATAAPGGRSFCFYKAAAPFSDTNNALGFDEQAECGTIDGRELGGEVAFLPVAAPQLVSSGTRALDGPTATFIAPREGYYAFAYSVQLTGGNLGYTYLIQSSPAQVARMQDVKLGLLIRRGGGAYDGSPLNGQPVDPYVVPHFVPLARGTVFENTTAGLVIPQTLGGAAADVYLEVGDSVQLCVMGRRRLIDQNSGATLIECFALYLELGAVSFACTAFAGSRELLPAGFLPPLLQRELLREFMLRTDTVPVADAGQRTVALLSREELSAAAGKPLDISALLDPDAIEYTPAAGAGVGAVVFASAVNEAEPPPGGPPDVVRIVVGPGTGEQRIDSLFAPVRFREYTLFPGGQRALLPTMATADTLAQPLAEVEWDVSGQPARLLRYVGPDAALTVPFQQRRVPLARAEWGGCLAWAGPAGAVVTYYAGTVQRLTRGHVGKTQVSLTPYTYRQLVPGRRVVVQGAAYTVEAVSQFDLASDENSATVELSREV